MNNVQKIGALFLGIAIAVAAAAAWRLWHIDDIFAILGVITGLGIAAEACGIRNASNFNLNQIQPERNHEQ